MSEVYFYHLTRQNVDQALLPLLGKCLANSWRVVIRGAEAQGLALLNDKLWPVKRVRRSNRSYWRSRGKPIPMTA